MSWCHCEDYPCCGHDAGMGPESAEDFLDSLEGEEREFADRYMTPCPECGEMRPKKDPSLRRYGMCYMCHQDPARRNSPVADANLAYFADVQQQLKDRIADLEQENARLREHEEDHHG